MQGDRAGVQPLPTRIDLSPDRSAVVTKLLIFMAASIGGAIGWWLGALVGLMTAFMLSIVGTAAGVYVARKWASDYLA